MVWCCRHRFGNSSSSSRRRRTAIRCAKATRLLRPFVPLLAGCCTGSRECRVYPHTVDAGEACKRRPRTRHPHAAAGALAPRSFYYAAKIIFLAYCQAPQTRGAEFIYTAFLQPWFRRNSPVIEARVSGRCRRRGAGVCSRVQLCAMVLHWPQWRCCRARPLITRPQFRHVRNITGGIINLETVAMREPEAPARPATELDSATLPPERLFGAGVPTSVVSPAEVAAPGLASTGDGVGPGGSGNSGNGGGGGSALGSPGLGKPHGE